MKPAAILCKSFQADEISIVSTIEAILRTTASMKKLKSTEMEDLPSVKKVVLRLKSSSSDSTTSKTYQSVEIAKVGQSLSFFTSHYKGYIDSLLACLHERLKDSSADATMLTHALKILTTHG